MSYWNNKLTAFAHIYGDREIQSTQRHFNWSHSFSMSFLRGFLQNFLRRSRRWQSSRRPLEPFPARLKDRERSFTFRKTRSLKLSLCKQSIIYHLDEIHRMNSSFELDLSGKPKCIWPESLQFHCIQFECRSLNIKSECHTAVKLLFRHPTCLNTISSQFGQRLFMIMPLLSLK